jgi:hypothetical protein
MVQDSGCKLQAGYAQQDREAHCHRYQATEATQAIAIAFKGAGILSGGSSATPPSQPAQIVTIFAVVATHQLAAATRLRKKTEKLNYRRPPL